MTPKEKAQELINKYFKPNLSSILYGIIEDLDVAKECALIAVDEIIEALSYRSLNDSPYTTLEARQFYIKVKQEINKL